MELPSRALNLDKDLHRIHSCKLLVPLHLDVPSTKFGKQITLIAFRRSLAVQQCSRAALQCLYPCERCFNKLLC